MRSYVQAAGSLKIKNPALEKYVAILSKGKKKTFGWLYWESETLVPSLKLYTIT